MARKNNVNEAQPAPASGDGGILGLVLLALAVFLLLALFSFDKHDLASNTAEPNAEIQNVVGRLGARVADVAFFGFGGAAYLLPPLLLLVLLGGDPPPTAGSASELRQRVRRAR